MDHRKWPIARDAFAFFIPLALLAGLVRKFFGRHLWIVPGAAAAFVLFFFRNPARRVSAKERELLSPADGRVMSVEEIPEETEFLLAPALKISIFLSLFDVHINLSPVGGLVVHTRYQPGKFLPAYKPQASTTNERHYLGLIADPGKANGVSSINGSDVNDETSGAADRILLVQIVGMAARRVRCWSKPGDRLEPGERFGLMKFGSCVELYVPASTTIFVKAGDKVKGGLTKIGRLP